jgi:hypothetical protein
MRHLLCYDGRLEPDAERGGRLVKEIEEAPVQRLETAALHGCEPLFGQHEGREVQERRAGDLEPFLESRGEGACPWRFSLVRADHGAGVTKKRAPRRFVLGGTPGRDERKRLAGTERVQLTSGEERLLLFPRQPRERVPERRADRAVRQLLLDAG